MAWVAKLFGLVSSVHILLLPYDVASPSFDKQLDNDSAYCIYAAISQGRQEDILSVEEDQRPSLATPVSWLTRDLF